MWYTREIEKGMTIIFIYIYGILMDTDDDVEDLICVYQFRDMSI